MTVLYGPNTGLIEHADPGEGHYDALTAALRAQDFFLNPRVTSITIATPPGSPVNGEAYILPATGATGAWAGNGTKIARWSTRITVPAWEFFTPKVGFSPVFCIADGVSYGFNGAIWTPRTPSSTPVTNAGSATMTMADVNNTVLHSSASANNYTVAPNASVPVPVNSVVKVIQTGAGQVTFLEGAGVTVSVLSPFLKKLDGQNAVGYLHKVAADSWILSGALDT